MEAAANFNINFNLLDYIQCSICLENYSNPKELLCRHLFCKKCIDDILRFNQDGSAVIDCPQRCERKTVISNIETTNDLGSNFHINNIVDAYHANNLK